MKIQDVFNTSLHEPKRIVIDSTPTWIFLTHFMDLSLQSTGKSQEFNGLNLQRAALGFIKQKKNIFS